MKNEVNVGDLTPQQRLDLARGTEAAPVGEREAFEAWAKSMRMVMRTDGETYYHNTTHNAWTAWKARSAYQRAQQPSAEAGKVRIPFRLWDDPDAEFPPNYARGWNDASDYYAKLNDFPQPSAGVVMLSDNDRVPDDYRNQATGYRAGWNDCAARLNGKEVGRG